MAFFNFSKKNETGKQFSLTDIPVFSSLSPAEIRLIEKKVRLQEFKRGDLVYQEGTPAEYFYVVLSGRFHVFAPSRQGRETLLHLYRGDHFGETSLLTGKHHSASVEARSDGIVLTLAKDDFSRFLQEIPAILHYLTRSLGHRLTKSADSNGRRREVKIAALYPAAYPQEACIFWLDFCGKLVRETGHKVVVLDLSGREPRGFADEFKAAWGKNLSVEQANEMDDSLLKGASYEHPSGFSYLAAQTGNSGDEIRRFSSLVTFLTYRFDSIMIYLPQDTQHAAFQTLKQTDGVYVFCVPESGNLNLCAPLLEKLQREYGFGKKDIKVLLYERMECSAGYFEESEKHLAFRIFSTLPCKSERSERYHGAVRYLAREFSEKLVGLALGSGAAYGLSHIGLLRVLEREKIPVDVIAGSSIGAVVGAFWGAGFSASQLEQVARSINKQNAFFKIIGFRDLSLAHRGFFKGNQMTRYLESYLGDMTFQDLKLPVKIIAADLFTTEAVLMDTGRVVDAIRASASIPGIFRPLRHKGMCLIDGGVIDPLPVKVLADMGVKKIIAANVLSSPADRAAKRHQDEQKRIHKLRELSQAQPVKKAISSFFYKLQKRYADNTFNVIMNTIQLMEYELAVIASQGADVVLHPKVFEWHWAEFYDPDKFIQAGEDCALQHLDAIKQLLRE